MRRGRLNRAAGAGAGSGRRGFTLIELLVVMAIITLLISILLPTLSKARQQAKNVKTYATLKSISDALEAYRTENESDQTAKETNGYPPSAEAEDPAYADSKNIIGAQWLVRYLMGKDLRGYAPRRNAPAALQNPGTAGEQIQWYEFNPDGSPKVERVGPYIEGVPAVPTKDLPQAALNPAGGDPLWGTEQQVFVDSFGYPILYYVANARLAQRTRPHIAGYGLTNSEPGIYTFKDNGRFTGMCTGDPDSGGGSCMYVSWNFDDDSLHSIEYFGVDPPDPAVIANGRRTFQYYIMDKETYTASLDSVTSPSEAATVPHRKDSFLLITAGKDALYGTSDDVQNF